MYSNVLFIVFVVTRLPRCCIKNQFQSIFPVSSSHFSLHIWTLHGEAGQQYGPCVWSDSASVRCPSPSERKRASAARVHHYSRWWRWWVAACITYISPDIRHGEWLMGWFHFLLSSKRQLFTAQQPENWFQRAKVFLLCLFVSCRRRCQRVNITMWGWYIAHIESYAPAHDWCTEIWWEGTRAHDWCTDVQCQKKTDPYHCIYFSHFELFSCTFDQLISAVNVRN